MGTVEEERDLVVADLAAYYKTAAVNLGERAESEAIDMVDPLIAAVEARGVEKGRVVGAAAEREKIRKGSKYIYCWEIDESNDASFWHVPVSALAPKESEK